jgi:hypothetical protein
MKHEVLRSITDVDALEFLGDPTSLGLTQILDSDERAYFLQQDTVNYTENLISLNLMGVIDSGVLCLGFKNKTAFRNWKKSTEYDYLSYIKPWLASTLIVIIGPYEAADPLFTGLKVISYQVLCDSFVRGVQPEEIPAHLGISWPEILATLVSNPFAKSWIPSGKFVDAMTPVPFVGETGLETLLVGQSLITQGLYEYVMGRNPSHFKGSSELPVDTVNWFGLLLFCNKLSEIQGFRPCYYDIDPGREGSAEWDRSANGYRLLTEKEWEYIARANRTFEYSGSDEPNEVAWYRKNSGRKAHPVGTKKENSFGTYDQNGNLSEWCWDLYDPKDAFRVLRGGDWDDGASFMHAAGRYYGFPSGQDYSFGGRLARSPDPLIP